MANPSHEPLTLEREHVTVIIPAYNEEATIGAVVADFCSREDVDEVLVVDNNCRDRTSELAAAAGARVVSETQAGYGCALRAGMDAAKDGVLVLTEADGSFKSHDLPKFMAFLESDTLVMGTRTTSQMVDQAANMRSVLRWGNVIVGKLVEGLWYLSMEPRLTDVGCTYRALHKSTWLKIKPGVRERGPAFSPEMMCEALRRRIRVIEIPVHYYARMGGESKHSANYRKLSLTALRMLRAILRKRLSMS